MCGNKGRATRTTLQPGTNHKATPGHFVCRHATEKSHAQNVEGGKNTKGDRCRVRPLRPNGLISHRTQRRSEEHTSELQSLMRISYAVFCLKTKTNTEYDTRYLYDIERVP